MNRRPLPAARGAEWIAWVAWVAVVAGLGVLATQAVGTPFALVAMAQAATPFAVPVLVVMAVGATAVRRHALAIAAAFAGLGYVAVTAPLVLAGSGPAAAVTAPRVSIAAANLLFENERVDDAADALLALDVDVLALSEVTPEIAAELHRHPLADEYPHRVERPAALASGLVVWSRLPLGPVGEQPDLRRAIDTTIVTGDGLLRLLLVHPPPPVYERTRWRAELRAIPRVVSETAFPTIVLGDFNASHFHPPFRRMVGSADLHDVLIDIGRPFTPTWPTDSPLPPFTPLDHIVLQRSVATVDADVATIPGSDHRAVVATVAFAAD